ncbi:MAG: precorrin-8X methylmutase [Rhodospirillales bacterium]|nr:precorrin-8X methylmutase [Rhodospirillales bacterium]
MTAYIRDADEIYRQSFSIIRAEADLTRIPPDLEKLAVRAAHACGMPGIVDDLHFSVGAGTAGRAALAQGAAILCDSAIVAEGVTRSRLPANNRVVFEPRTDPATTPQAATVAGWRPHLGGAVVAIGTDATGLFRLLELLDEGAPRPALVLAFPFGFVGAAEAKQMLVDDPRGVPYVTLAGRRGGTAIAAAAINALATERE